MPAIKVSGLHKRFGVVVAVDDLSFEVEKGSVTGFLGPNGKTTTLRMLLGLVRPTAGTATFDGVPYRALPEPSRLVGAVLEASSYHPGRTARDHLRVLARTAGLPAARVGLALEQVGLADAARRRVGGFSLGMRQRLGLAAPLLGEPRVLILDEPANGLDPEGIHWLREFLQSFARSGRTVLVSSHVLAEVAQTVDHVVIISRGRLVTQSTLEALTERAVSGVRVRTPQAEALRQVLASRGVQVVAAAPGELLVSAPAEVIGRAVAEAGIVVYEMRLEQPDLEDVFLELTTTAKGAGRSPA